MSPALARVSCARRPGSSLASHPRTSRPPALRPLATRGNAATPCAASHAPREGDVISGSGSEDGLRGSRKRQGSRALAAACWRAGLRPGPSARPRALRAPRGPLERRVSFLASVAFPMWHTGPTCACPSARSDTGGRHTANPPPLRTPHLVPAPSAPSRGRRTGQQMAPQAFLLRPVGGERARGPEAPRAGRGDAGPEGGGPGPPQRAGSWKHLESFEDATRGERHT